MNGPAPSPLQPLAPWAGLPPVWLKREDLLPHGGGAKVRRLLAHLAATPAGEQRPLAVLSERGAHTFVALARLHQDGALDRPLVFLEAARPRTAYAEANRALYLGRPRIRVHAGPLPWLLLRWLAWGARPRAVERLGIGGQTPGGEEAAASAHAEVLGQLAALPGPAGRTVHVLAAASGTLAAGLLRSIAAAGTDEVLWLVPTGPAPARGRLRRRLGGEPRVTLLDRVRLGEREIAQAVDAFHARSGVVLDPRHAARAWIGALDAAPRLARPGDRLVLWVTGPRLAAPPGAPPFPTCPASSCS